MTEEQYVELFENYKEYVEYILSFGNEFFIQLDLKYGEEIKPASFYDYYLNYKDNIYEQIKTLLYAIPHYSNSTLKIMTTAIPKLLDSMFNNTTYPYLTGVINPYKIYMRKKKIRAILK